MKNLQYIDILREFEDFFSRHLMVTEFVAGKMYDFSARENKYSAVVVVPTMSSISSTSESLGFDLYFIDRVVEDGSNLNDVFSSELLIVQDFVAYFSNRNGTWNLAGENITIEPIYKQFDDIVAGWQLSVSVSLPYYKNICEIPLDDEPLPPPPPTPPTPPIYRRDHSQLANLEYDKAGHIGFQRALDAINAGANIEITHDRVGNVVISAKWDGDEISWGRIKGQLADQQDLNERFIAIDNEIAGFQSLIPTQASVDNQLADKEYVNSELAGYANIDANNFTRKGTTLLSSFGLPDYLRYEDLTVGSSGSTYTAPANGWFFARGQSIGNVVATLYLQGITVGSYNLEVVSWSPTGTNRHVGCLFPVNYGDSINLIYGNSTGGLKLVFVYAKGNP